MALYTHCLVARKEAALQKMQIEGFTEKEYGMVRLESVGDVLFQALMLDNIRLETRFCLAPEPLMDNIRLDDGRIYAEYISIYLTGG